MELQNIKSFDDFIRESNDESLLNEDHQLKLGETLKFKHKSSGKTLKGKVISISPAKNSIDNKERYHVAPIDKSWVGFVAFTEDPMYQDEQSFDDIVESQLNEEYSWNDYPQGAVDAAKKAIKWKEQHGDEVDGGTQIGWTRANQLANKEKLTLDTIKRMKAFFDRHQGNKSVAPEHKDEPWKDNGLVSHLLWGGDAGYEWAKKKIKEIESKNND